MCAGDGGGSGGGFRSLFLSHNLFVSENKPCGID